MNLAEPRMYRTPSGWGVAQYERFGKGLVLCRRRYFKDKAKAEACLARWTGERL